MYENYLQLKIKDLVKILNDADDAYHNKGDVIMSDQQYDLIKEHLFKISPKNPYFKKVGFKPPEKLKVKLPYYLGSQNKIKYGNIKDLNNWFSKYNNPLEYIISEKLDGISCLYMNDNGEIKIFTRGDGTFGTDISFIKDFITFPKKIPEGFAVRGELLLTKKNWDLLKDMGANARNVVAGLINSKTIKKDVLKKVDFVVYDVFNERMNNEDALKLAKKLKFKIVKYKIIKDNLSNDHLFNILKDFKKHSEYEIDGIVITHNKPYNIKNGDNPPYSFAFKSNELLDFAEVIVTNVEWNISKDRYMKPIVQFNPVKLNGVIIKQATGFNADFIEKNKIGIGSIIKIQRSGEVIPHIISIIKIADNGLPLMPTIPYKWNKTHIDIIAELDEKNRDVDIKNFIFFMKSLKIKGVSEGILTKLYDNGFDTLKKIINISKNEILDIAGFKEKSASNLLEALAEIKTKNCNDIMIASNIIGRGLGGKKLEIILKSFPEICQNKKKGLDIKIEDLMKINGMGELTSNLFKENLEKFYEFYDDLGFKLKKVDEIKHVISNEIFKNVYFVFTGFRSDELEKYIKDNGGEVESNITNKTTYLIMKDMNKITGKITKAIDKGVKIISKDDFIKKYNLIL
jgi:NAD-dependent DNA ligase